MTDQVTSALLLAAGRGSRFRPDGEAIPKCLIEVGGKSLLQRLCENLVTNGITKLLIVTGYMAEAIEQAARECGTTLHIDTVHNPHYASTNNVYSLWLAREVIKGDFLLVESDLLYGPGLIAACIAPDHIVVSELLPWMNGTTLDIGSDGLVERFCLLRNEGKSGQYKTVNVYSFSTASWARISIRLDEHVLHGETGDYYEAVLAKMHEQGELELRPVVYPVSDWYEIDTAEDLRAAERLLVENPSVFK